MRRAALLCAPLLAALLLASCGARPAAEEGTLEGGRSARSSRGGGGLAEAFSALPSYRLDRATPMSPEQLAAIQRVRVPIERAPARGARRPLITIVVFSDFQCPYCGRVLPTLGRLLETYPEEIRLVFRHFPLPFHREAEPAAQASIEAYIQGGDAGFWRFHDQLFTHQRELGRAELLTYATRAGLDATLMRQALDQGDHGPKVQADIELGRRLGVRGTPAFFINGRSLVGAQPYEAFERVVREELAVAQAVLESGRPPEEIYPSLMADASETPPEPPRPTPSAAPPPPQPQGPQQVSVQGAPVDGPRDALVTIVEFSDFQCPFCARVQSTLAQLRQAYGNDLRIVHRHNPLAFHPNARPAAIASYEVFTQAGDVAFYQYADLLYQNSRNLDPQTLVQLAAQIPGVNPAAVGQAVAGATHGAAIDADAQLAASVGARGTPTFFINGRRLTGAQPLSRFRALIDQELTRARGLLSQGVPRDRIYETASQTP